MADQIPLSEISSEIAPTLVSVRNWTDASFLSLPLVYPSGSFVTVRLTYEREGIRVSDCGFAYREAESFGAGRSFAQTARHIADDYDLTVGKRSVYADVHMHEVTRAIFDVSAASHAIAEKIVARASVEGEASIADALHEKLDRLFPSRVTYESTVVGSSSTEWDVDAVAKLDGKTAVFQAVPNYPITVFRTSTAFRDIALLDNPPSLVSVVSDKQEMGKNYSILAQAGRVIEINQGDNAYLRAAGA